MKTYILAAAVTLLLGLGPAAAYDDNFANDTPSLAFAKAKSFSGGADLSIIPAIKSGNAQRAVLPGMTDDQVIGGGTKTPSRVFH